MSRMAETMEIMAETTSSATPEQIWASLGDPASYADWWSDWHSATTDEMPLAVGGAITMRTTDHDPERGGVNAVRDFHHYRMPITVCEPDSRLYVRNNSVGTEDLCFDLQPVEGGGTRIIYRRIANVPKMMKFLGNMMESRLRHNANESVQALAAIAEGRSAETL
jgi:uncharacterized protein YndB with AHSA1/START domain